MRLQPEFRPLTLRLGTRGSQLARWQAEWVAGELKRLGHTVELVEIATAGDLYRARPIEDIGTRGVFTKAIQDALLDGRIDVAVHSLKDLPTEEVPGLRLAAVPPRENPADVLVEPCGAKQTRSGDENPDLGNGSSAASTLARLPIGARVGTGSVRRRAQLLHARSDLVVEEVRGNVDTRLRKLDEWQFDAIVLAQAGLSRLGLAERISCTLPFNVMLPAVGQGAIGIECRDDAEDTIHELLALNDPETHMMVIAERALLAALRGGCMAPVGAYTSRVTDKHFELQAVVLSADGKQRLFASEAGQSFQSEELGKKVAALLIEQGASDLIAEGRNG